MATAVEPSSAPSTPGKTTNLPVVSILGAIYILATLAAAFFAVPALWRYIEPKISADDLSQLRATAQVIVLVGLLGFGLMISSDASKGTKGGSFLIALTVLVVFFIARAFAVNIEGGAGMIVGLGVAIGLLFVAVRFFFGQTGQRWMVGLDEQGWFSFAQYKRSLGVRVRRLTILGILIVGGTGAWSMQNQGLLPGAWRLTMPVGPSSIIAMTDARFVVPALVAIATLWIAWRAVNMPAFTEFLIATEAEMNKVSWSTWKRLRQDTVVVLLTTLVMTLFLLVVDLFWGWLLSRPQVGVLPARSTSPNKGHDVQEQKW